MFRRLLRTLTWISWTLGAIVILALISVVAIVRSSLPQLDGELSVAGLHAEVQVQRDAQGTVSLAGHDRLDLARATGFVHAQDRYFQMDLLRRDAAGELTALFGPAALNHDQLRRVHRMRWRAQQVLEQASADERALLAAYTQGVNVGLQQLGSKPFEYWLLRSTPAPWLPEDSLLVSYAMWFDLTDEQARRDTDRALIADALPEAIAGFLFPQGSIWDSPVAGPSIKAEPIPEWQRSGTRLSPAQLAPQAQAPELEERGSNSWAVSAAASASGRAMLANDMHLGLRLPNTWYRLRLRVSSEAAPLDISGVSLPGLPLIIAGSNGHVAWGFTNSYGDWSDRIVVADWEAQVGRSLRTTRRQVELGHGQVAAFEDSALGPVTHNSAFDGRAEVIQWLAHAPQASNLRLAWLEQARDVDEALAVATQAGIPPQNFVVADAGGRIGWTVAGRLPLRDPQPPQQFLRDVDGRLQWLAPTDYPRIIDPAGGLIWTANSRVVTDERLQLLGEGGYALGARARQIRDALQEAVPRNIERMRAIQLDDRALFLRRWHQMLMDLLSPAVEQADWRRAQARQHLSEWGERAAVDSVGYRIVRSWRDAVGARVMPPLIGPVLQRQSAFDWQRFAQTEDAIWQLITERPAALLPPGYADWDALLLEALDASLKELGADTQGLALATWGQRNRLQMRHPLSHGLPWLAPWLDMLAEPLPGDRYMPRVQGAGFGASERFAVSPGDERNGYFHMPGGASGHPWSPFYRAGHGDWVEGRASSFLPGEPAHTLRLLPPTR